jgi:adenylosuccinate synthase
VWRKLSVLLPYCFIASRFQGLAAVYQRMFPDLQVDVDSELVRYKVFAERIRPYVVESVSYLHSALRRGQKVLVEGANAAMLDIDFGIYIASSVFTVTSLTSDLVTA